MSDQGHAASLGLRGGRVRALRRGGTLHLLGRTEGWGLEGYPEEFRGTTAAGLLSIRKGKSRARKVALEEWTQRSLNLFQRL